jgi:hypothetical protein
MRPVTEDEIETMRRLRSDGLGYKRVAAVVGRAPTTVLYWTNEDYRARKNAYMRERDKRPERQRTPEERERRNQRRRERYANDPQYREQRREERRRYRRERYATDPEFRAAKAEAQRRLNKKKSAALARVKREQEIQHAVKKDGAALAEAYTFASKLDQVLGQARREAQDTDKRRAISRAHARRDEMMDEIIRGLGIS